MTELNVKKGIHLFQIIDGTYYYDTADKSFSDRREKWAAWRPNVVSNTFYLQNNQVVLNQDLQNRHHRFVNNEIRGNALFITDVQPKRSPIDGSFHLNKIEAGWGSSHSAFRTSIFQFEQQEEGGNLYLEWDYFTVGLPKRERFKLITLQKDQPVYIKINGKLDFNYSSRRARSYCERHIMVQYLGIFKHFQLASFDQKKIVKPVPSNYKVIDLMKRLY